MKFLDALLGRVKPAPSKTDALFSISTAQVTLATKLDILPAGKAGICFKIVQSTSFERLKSDLEELLELGKKETSTEFRMVKDAFGYLWIVLSDAEFEDLVTTLHLVSETLIENGFGGQLLSSVFRFERAAGTARAAGEAVVYFIYNYKKGRFYPFVPLKGKGRARDEQYEMKLGSLLERELPVEKEVENWYPMWGVPV
ncbi:hypothetical protein B6V00_01340 [ANME-1 cluster archaeon ex4572_4]|nr:hypothetical protein [Methanophagales archaeon]OYT67252.1 MAG: hypothetical protein B6V00_01340 [ANME-1 cluster archaeon ex4572_4]